MIPIVCPQQLYSIRLRRFQVRDSIISGAWPSMHSLPLSGPAHSAYSLRSVPSWSWKAEAKARSICPQDRRPPRTSSPSEAQQP